MSHSLTRRSLTVLVAAAFLAAACTSGRTQNQPTPPPVVTFQNPSEGAFLHGTVTIDARAVGQVKIATFKFDAPAALATTVAALDPTTKSAVLSAQLDLSSFVDGPLTVTVTAKDELGGSTSKDLTFTVAAKAPTISIASPAAASSIHGAAVAVTATASAQAGATITALELLTPPQGMGTNTSAAASLYAATWDTTQAPEGPVTLHFRATDSTGLVGDASITTTVDNVPFGQLDTYVFAGAPIQDAQVEVWALSDITGAVNTTVGTNGLLGAAGPTDENGHVVVSLTAENYSGPIQLRTKPASGSTLQYVDPADPGNGFIQIPSSLTLTSILTAYTTGTTVTAPITLTTTLADAELLAYAAGNHRLHSGAKTLTAAAAFGDGLFTQHVQASTPRWNLRTTVPVDLAASPTTLTDRAYAAFTDVALNQLGKDLGSQVHVTGVITAPFITAKLLTDLSADGQLDGKGAGGSAITTQTGSPPYVFDENTLRVRLANALDTWVQSSRNVSSLDRSSLSGANVYTQVSEDTSELFGPAAVTPFDNTAPAVSVVTTYGAGNAAPFGGTYVSGPTRFVVTATDGSGVKSLSVKLGTNILDSAATIVTSPDGQTMTYTVVVNTALMADLSYMLNVTATDQRNNTATTTLATITTDNTAPTVTQVQPLPTTYYSASVPFDGTASDGTGSGVASFTTTGFSNLTDGDATAAHFLANWTIPVAASDGTAAGTWSACDNVGNCATPALAVHVDRTPPTITVNGPVASYTNTAAVTLTVTAADVGAGVGAVYAQVPGKLATTGTFAAGVWTLAGIPLFPGINSIQIWGTDLAQTPNGLAATGVVQPITYANSVPTFIALYTPSYADERNMTLTASTVPAQYQLASATKVAVAPSGHIYKSAARLSSAGLTPAILEGANPDNIPFVQLKVPYTNTTAPVATIRYTLNVGGTVYGPSDLAPWTSPTSDASGAVYDLPLTRDLFPALATTAGAIPLTLTATVTDAAGQSGNLAATTFTFHTLPAPVYVAEDTNYPTYGDPRSAFAYRLNNNTYLSQWDPTNVAFYNGQVRLVRYLVSNPTSVAVAITPTTSGTWRAAENWTPFTNGVRTASPGTSGFGSSGPYLGAGQAFTQDSFNFYDYWDQAYYSSGGTLAACQVGQPFFSCTTPGQTVHSHELGNTNALFTCLPDTYFSAPTPQALTAATAPLATGVFASPQQAGGEVVAPTTVSGAFIVPAASGGLPGALVIYIARPVAAARSITTSWNAYTTGNRYENLKHIYWVYEKDHSGGYYSAGCSWHAYRAYRGAQWLTTAADAVSGSLGLTTQPTTGAALVGESATGFTATINVTLPPH